MGTKQPKVTRRKITEYIPDSRNANLGSERGLAMIEKGLNKVGAGRSIVVDAHDKIPAGNKTLEAAVLAGIEDVIEIETDGTALIVHKRTDWDLDDPTGAAREYAYLDNRASEVGLTWDANVIAADVEAGVDLSEMFSQPELGYVLNPIMRYADEERGLNPDERLDIYMNATIKQIVLLFDNDQYKQVVETMALIRSHEHVETNTEAFLRMLDVYEEHTSLPTGT